MKTKLLFTFASVIVHFSFCLCARAQSPAPSGTVLTIAGHGSLGLSGDGGLATNAAFNNPLSLAIGPDGTLYVADDGNFRIRAVRPLVP